MWGFLVGSAGKELACQYRRCMRCGFNPWVRKISWRRKWQPAPVFLPGNFHGQRSLAGYSPLSHKESDTTEHACTGEFKVESEFKAETMHIQRPWGRKSLVNV